MNPYYQDNHDTLYCEDFRKNDLPDESVQMVVTSPPYWGLRKYSGEQDLIWLNGKNCRHEWGEEIKGKESGRHDTNDPTSTNFSGWANWDGGIGNNAGNFCRLCGAWKGAYGLEPTPEMYVQHTIEILREIRRVLRKDGVVFWNIGDSYTGSGQGGGGIERDDGAVQRRTPPRGLKPKDLCLIPFRVAIAAQTDGWWVRSVIIWLKPNPMPESVTDRPTESHEYILMLTKSAKYYWDADAVREPHLASTLERIEYSWAGTELQDGFRSEPDKTDKMGSRWATPAGRNIRTVWEFPTQPYPKAHFAVFPEKLPELCIKAASREGDTVLDPFAGAGTTLWVAKKLNRQAVGYEISGEYCELAVERNRQQVMV